MLDDFERSPRGEDDRWMLAYVASLMVVFLGLDFFFGSFLGCSKTITGVIDASDLLLGSRLGRLLCGFDCLMGLFSPL